MTMARRHRADALARRENRKFRDPGDGQGLAPVLRIQGGSSMRSVKSVGVRGVALALIALACAHCGATKGAASSSGKKDAGDDPSDIDASTQVEPTDGGAGDGEVLDANGGDATVLGAGNDHCENATPIPLSGVNPRIDLKATMAGATHDVDVDCSTDKGPDVFYSFAISKRVIVYADTFGAGWDTVLFLTNSACTPIPTTMDGDAVCSDDGCSTKQSQIVALLEPGSYRLGLAGHGSAGGEATIHFEWALAGGTVAKLPTTNGVVTGTTSGSGNIDGLSNACVAAGPENSYWWARCPSDAARIVSASTCEGTTWESVVEIQVPKLAPNQSSGYQCAVNSSNCSNFQGATKSVAVPAGAGLGVVSIDGQSGGDMGTYSMSIAYTP
jgi:hypothetical protein